MKPSTSFNCLEKNFAANVARPAYGGIYLNVADAVPSTGTSGTYNRKQETSIDLMKKWREISNFLTFNCN